jgi:hypothetical protein
MTEDDVHQDADAELPKTRAKKPLPAQRNKAIDEKCKASLGCLPQIEDPEKFFPKLLFE